MTKMLKLSAEVKDKTTLARLEGQVDESFSLAQELPKPSEKLDVYCAGINRINSTGVKKWMLYFQGASKHSLVRFLEVSPALVEQFNLIANFACGGKIESIGLPYSCNECHHSFTVIKNCVDIVSAKGVLAPQSCPKCMKPGAEFDDLPEEYFHFLLKRST